MKSDFRFAWGRANLAVDLAVAPSAFTAMTLPAFGVATCLVVHVHVAQALPVGLVLFFYGIAAGWSVLPLEFVRRAIFPRHHGGALGAVGLGAAYGLLHAGGVTALAIPGQVVSLGPMVLADAAFVALSVCVPAGGTSGFLVWRYRQRRRATWTARYGQARPSATEAAMA